MKNIKLFNPYLDLFHLIQALPEEVQLQARKKLIWAYSWAVPDSEAIRKLAEYSPLLELGSGTGYWAWLIAQAGGKIKCFDVEPHQPPRWMETQAGSPEVISQYPEYTLFLCWPPLNDTMAIQALEIYTGRYLLYVGEWRGRTADERFHEALERNWELQEEVPLPHWAGYSDQLLIWVRK